MTASPLSGLTVAAARRAMSARLREAGIETPELDARLLIGEVLKLDLTGLAGAARRGLSPREAEAAWASAMRRLRGEPVARILGRKEFWGLTLQVSPATLVPRPETETVVEAALASLAKNRRAGLLGICDIGTGSGAILLALLSELGRARGVGTDLSEAALATARANALALGLGGRAHFVRCDYAAALRGPFDLIVSNPPYIRAADIARLAPEVRDFDPRGALDGGESGLRAYRALAEEAPRLLLPGGRLIVEVGENQASDVTAIFAGAGLIPGDAPRHDLSGIARVVVAARH
jgi:release factor glutamine methyltransferase